MKTIRETGKYELQKEIDELKSVHENEKSGLYMKYRQEQEVETHDVLIGACDNKKLVYFGEIPGSAVENTLVKIGSTTNMRQRVGSLRKDYGLFNLLRVFECQEHFNFEKFLHQHVDIKRYSYKKPVQGKVSLELYDMNDDQLKRALGIASRNVVQFRIQTEKVMDIQDVIRTEVAKEVAVFFQKRKHDDEDVQDVQNKSNRGHCTSLGPKIQMYTPDGQLVKTFNQLIDAVRGVSNTCRYGIMKAYDQNLIYCDFRRMKLDRSMPDDTVNALEPPVKVKKVRMGYVAEVNPDGTQIERVYSNFKDAAEKNGFASVGAVQKLMKRGGKLNGNVMTLGRLFR